MPEGRMIMRVSANVRCIDFPCMDVKHDLYQVTGIKIDPDRVRIVLISEAPPENPSDNYYAGINSLFAQTTLQAFQDAGMTVGSLDELLKAGIYFTTAVKCGKQGYGIKSGTIKQCSTLLENELNLFSNIMAYLLMGDVAIKAINYISIRETGQKAIPAGSTYKIRGGRFAFRGIPAFPSYTQAGPAYFIEKSKRIMIAQDIRRALELISD